MQFYLTGYTSSTRKVEYSTRISLNCVFGKLNYSNYKYSSAHSYTRLLCTVYLWTGMHFCQNTDRKNSKKNWNFITYEWMVGVKIMHKSLKFQIYITSFFLLTINIESILNFFQGSLILKMTQEPKMVKTVL